MTDRSPSSRETPIAIETPQEGLEEMHQIPDRENETAMNRIGAPGIKTQNRTEINIPLGVDNRRMGTQ
jgi:hypothetical protein